jgi:methylaspartate mutase epsilon subunit
MKIIQMEASSILDKTLELGDGDVVLGAVRGIEAGIVDVPWAPNKNAKGLVIPVRDSQGAVRYLEFGNLPFGREIRQYHEEKLSRRAQKEKKEVDYETAIFDITEISQMA